LCKRLVWEIRLVSGIRDLMSRQIPGLNLLFHVMVDRTIGVLCSPRSPTQLLFRLVGDVMAGLYCNYSRPFLQSSNALALSAACSVFVTPDHLWIKGLLLEQIYI